MTNVAIFDLDGTLADASHRMHYIKDKPKNWTMFFKECVNDTPIHDIIQLYKYLSGLNYKIFIVSGRSDEVRQETEDWLAKYVGPKYYTLYMRKEGDHRPDWKVKHEILQTKVCGPAWGITIRDIKYVFDDRDQVVNMWRANGLRCLQVASGAF